MEKEVKELLVDCLYWLDGSPHLSVREENVRSALINYLHLYAFVSNKMYNLILLDAQFDYECLYTFRYKCALKYLSLLKHFGLEKEFDYAYMNTQVPF